MIVENGLKGSSQFFTSENSFLYIYPWPTMNSQINFKTFLLCWEKIFWKTMFIFKKYIWHNSLFLPTLIMCLNCFAVWVLFLFSAYMSPTLSQIVSEKDTEFKEALNQITASRVNRTFPHPKTFTFNIYTMRWVISSVHALIIIKLHLTDEILTFFSSDNTFMIHIWHFTVPKYCINIHL